MKTTTLHLALKSHTLVKLHVIDDSDVGNVVVVDIPVKNLIKISSCQESYSSTASYSILYHCCMCTMVRRGNNENFPVSFSKNRELVTYHKNKEGIVRFSTDSELTTILENAITKRLMDDNDGVILHIFCNFQRPFLLDFEDAKKIGAAATTAADNVMQQMKNWVTKAQDCLERKRSSASHFQKEYGPEYDVIDDFDAEKKASNPLDWANRFVQFLLSKENNMCENNRKKSNRVVLTHVAENTIHILFEGVMMTSGLISTGAVTASEFILSVIAHHNESASEQSNTTVTINSPIPNLDDNNIKSANSVSMLEEKNDQGIEIIFDAKSTTTSSEWKVFFDLEPTESSNMLSSEAGELIDMCDSSLSRSSNEKSSTSKSNLSSSLVLSEVNSDDVSWNPDDSQSCLLEESKSIQSYESQISAFSIVDSDDSWDVLDGKE